HLADSPVPAPPPMIGLPAATWAARRWRHCSRVKGLMAAPSGLGGGDCTGSVGGGRGVGTMERDPDQLTLCPDLDVERYWPQPQSRDVGVLSDPALYGEALQVARDQGTVNSALLQRELGPRLRGQFLVQERQSERVARQLVLELQRYGWLKAEEGGR